MIRSLRFAGRRRTRAPSVLGAPRTRPSAESFASCQLLLPRPIAPADFIASFCPVQDFGTSSRRIRSLRSSGRIFLRGRAWWQLHRSILPFSSKSTKTKDATTREGSNADTNDKENNSNDVYEHWWIQITSLPNLITLTRIGSAPLLSYLIVSQRHDMALVGCLVAGMSDVLDGYLAKNHNMSTVLGTYLDPLADKVIINVLSASLWYAGTLPSPLVALWLAKDVALTVGAYRYVAKNTSSGHAVLDPWTTPLKVNPTVTSKVNTALQFATLSLAILVPMHPDVAPALTTLCWGTGLTTVASGFSYLGYSAFSSSGNRRNGSGGDANPRS